MRLQRFFLALLFVYAMTALSEEPVKLPPARLKAARAPESHETLFSSQFFIRQSEIEREAAHQLTELFQGQAGVQTFNTTGNSQQPTISIRGFGENAFANSLVLIDGYPLVNPDLGNLDLNVLPVEQINRVIIEPGSHSVEFGDQAVGGVVQILTKIPEKKSAYLKLGYGSDTQRFLLASLADRFSNGFFYQLDLNGERSHQYRDHNQLTWYLFNGLFGYETEKDLFDVRYHVLSQQNDLPGALTRQQVHQNRRQTSTPTDHATENTQRINLHFKHVFNKDWRLQGQLATRYAKTDGRLFSPFLQYRTVTTFLPRMIGTVSIQEYPIQLRTGIDASNDQYRFTSYSTMGNFKIADQNNMISGFSIATFPLPHRIYFKAGARYAGQNMLLDSTNVWQSVFVSEGTLAYQPHQTFKLYLRSAGNYRFPKADEQNNFVSQTAVTPLKVQRGISYEAGVRYKNDRFENTIELYQLDLKNEIAFALPTPTQIRATNRNLDPTRRRGLIVGIKYRPIQPLTLLGNYAFVNPVYRSGPFKNNLIPFVAKQIFRIAASIRFYTYWTLYGETILTGQRFPAENDTNTGPRLGSYTLYNVSLAYHRGPFHASIRGNNITGKKYYSYVLQPPGAPNFYYPAPQANVLLTVRYDFV